MSMISHDALRVLARANVPAVVLYHSADNDGKLSGYLSARLLQALGFCVRAFGVNYGEYDYVALRRYCHGAVVMLVDFSFKAEEMVELTRVSRSFIWVDHHASSAPLVGSVASSWVHATELGRKVAACQLVSELLRGSGVHVTTQVVDLVDAWDTWKTQGPFWDTEDPAYLFHCGLSEQDTSPFVPLSTEELDVAHSLGCSAEELDVECSPFWTALLTENEEVSDTIEQGRQVAARFERENERLVQEAFTLHWEERTWLAINANIPGSQVFAKVFDPQRHDSMLSFAYSPQAKAWKVHLRAYDEVAFPVDKIAVQYGGGGHRGAAGFACKQLPFVL